MLINLDDVCLQSTPFASLFERAAQLSNATKRQDLFDAAIFQVWSHQSSIKFIGMYIIITITIIVIVFFRVWLSKQVPYASLLLAVEVAFFID